MFLLPTCFLSIFKKLCLLFSLKEWAWKYKHLKHLPHAVSPWRSLHFLKPVLSRISEFHLWSWHWIRLAEWPNQRYVLWIISTRWIFWGRILFLPVIAKTGGMIVLLALQRYYEGIMTEEYIGCIVKDFTFEYRQ